MKDNRLSTLERRSTTPLDVNAGRQTGRNYRLLNPNSGAVLRWQANLILMFLSQFPRGFEPNNSYMGSTIFPKGGAPWQSR